METKYSAQEECVQVTGTPKARSKNLVGGSPHSWVAQVLVSVVVPTLREADNLPLLVPRITEALQLWSHEIIIVDDNSADGTEAVVASLRELGYNVRLIVRTDQRGLSSAVMQGFFSAKGRWLICMDADLSHPPEILPGMIGALEQDQVEFVIGSRYVTGGSTSSKWGLFRKVNSLVATLLARPLCKARDPLSGYFGLSREVFERGERFDPLGFKIGLELIVRCRCCVIEELPIQFDDRCRGESKLNFREQLNYLRHIKRLADFKFGGWSQLAQFYTVGASGMVVDFFCYALLLRVGIALPVARALSIFAAICWNFALNRCFSFSGRQFERPIVIQYFSWLGCTALGAMVSWSVAVSLTSLSTFFGRHVFFAAMLGIATGSWINFVLARYYVFAEMRKAAR